MLWIEDPREARGAALPIGWLVRHSAEADRKAVPPTRPDLADAARAPSFDQGAGRLWRRRLLRTLAAEALAAPAVGLAIERTGLRLSVAGPRRLEASVSGRGPWSLICLHEGSIGTDLEPAGAAPDAAQALGMPAEAALRRWLLVEAWAKASGETLDQALTREAPPDVGWRWAYLERAGVVGCVLWADMPGEAAMVRAAGIEPARALRPYGF